MQRLNLPNSVFGIIVVTLFVMISSLPNVDGISVNVNGFSEFQTIEGLGGGMESHDEMENDNEFWDLLFNDLGVSAIYLCPLEDHASYDSKGVFPMLRKAKSYGVQHYYVQFISYPANWKDNFDYLLPEFYDDVAYHILGYIGYIKDATNVDITNFNMIDEPTIGTQGPYSRFKIKGSEYVNLLKTAGPIIRDGNSNVRIHVPDNWNIDLSTSYAKIILSDTTARNYIDVLSTHVYGWPNLSNPQKWRAFADIAKIYDKKVANSETWNANGNPSGHPAGIHTAKWIHHAFVDGQAIVFLWWFMLDKGKYNRGGNGFIYSKYWPPGEFDINGVTKYGYAFKQFARWVKPGAVRVGTISNDNNILASSYKHPENNTFTMVVINDKPQEDKTVTFNITNLSPISNLNVYRTSATENSVYLDQVSVTNNTFRYSIPKESITTFTDLETGDLKKTKKSKIRR